MARLESTKRAKLKTAKQHQPSQKSKSLTCCYLLPRFWVTPYLVPIGTVDLKKNMFPSTSYSFLFQIKAVAQYGNLRVSPPNAPTPPPQELGIMQSSWWFLFHPFMRPYIVPFENFGIVRRSTLRIPMNEPTHNFAKG